MATLHFIACLHHCARCMEGYQIRFWILVFEASSLNASAIQMQVVVQQQLRVYIRRKRCIQDSSALAHLRPWGAVLIVGLLCDIFQLELGKVGNHSSVEAGFNLENDLQD